MCEKYARWKACGVAGGWSLRIESVKEGVKEVKELEVCYNA